MMETLQDNITGYYCELFESHKESLNIGSSNYINLLRELAIKNFSELGFPAKKDERYKYTFLQPVFSHPFNYSFAPANITFKIEDIFTCDVPKLDTHLFILLNGYWFDKTHPLISLNNGIIAGSFAAASMKYPDIVEKYYAKSADFTKDGLVALNTSFAQDGFFLYIPKGITLEKPIQIVNLLLNESELMIHQRNLIIAEENTECNLVICDHTLSPSKYLSNNLTEIYAGKESRMNVTRVQNEHNDASSLNNSFISQDANSKVTYHTITLHGGLIRNNMHVILSGKGAENNLTGLFLADQEQHIDNSVFIDHASPDCTSNQLYKGILNHNATGAFNGKIMVRKDAQHTNAYQRNNNILLTNDAHMYSKPQLEIYADDVKCSHGATVGQLDEEALFYLRSRGINEHEATNLLMFAFAHEIIGQLKPDPLRMRIDDLVDKRIRGKLSGCNNCAKSVLVKPF
jgi:Fe-S cluster assembly protein SufD